MNKDIQNLPLAARQAASALGAYPREMDFDRELSFGKKNNTNNMIDEAASAARLSWSITNATNTNKFIVFAAYGSGFNTTMFADSAAILAAAGADAIFANGVLINDEGSVSGKDLTVDSLDSRRKINEFVKYFSYNPTRLTGFSMKSKATDGTKESSNYDNLIKSYWFSPLETIQENELNLRPLQRGGDNFNADMLDVDFLRQNFKAVLSNEHFLVIQVNAGTVLTITASIGAQLSAAQRFFRKLNKADEVLRPYRAGM